MQIIPQPFIDRISQDKLLNKSLLDIDEKVEKIVTAYQPFFFFHYTNHGINHFRDTLKMSHQLIDIDAEERAAGTQAPIDSFTPLNTLILTASILFHDLGMHLHFKGFKQLINGYFDDVRVSFFDDKTWKEEWENYMIEARRFSGRERINLFGEEQTIINDIDFTKDSLDSDTQKLLVGEFIRRHHGRLAHEIALKGFPIEAKEIIVFAPDLKIEYKDIIGVVARSHSMPVREALEYIEEQFPADPHFPYDIEVAFIMCVLRVADYFQFDNTRTNAFLLKLASINSPFSRNEHEAHLATEYFKTDAADPETLFVDLKPKDGLMYTKLLKLFNEIQKELDTSFAVLGELYGLKKKYLKLRYRRIKTSLKNRKVISKLGYVADTFSFEADTDLFKLLVGPLYGYDTSFGVRELIQNAVDACLELAHKNPTNYAPNIKVDLYEQEGQYYFSIIDNGKGMGINEIKNYYLKAGASFRNSMEWKIDYQTEDHTPAIRRTGKFGIGVLASFLIGDTINVVTKRFTDEIGYEFSADLKNQYIEVRKRVDAPIGSRILINITKSVFEDFKKHTGKITKWYVLSYPNISYTINGKSLKHNDGNLSISLINDKQKLKDAVTLEFSDFDDIIWKYESSVPRIQHEEGKFLSINGIRIPNKYFFPTERRYYGYGEKPEKTIYDELFNFPYLSILDRNGLIDLELNRNAIRGHLPFMKELVQSCKLDFLYKLIFFNPTLNKNHLLFPASKLYNSPLEIPLDAPQFGGNEIFVTSEGHILNDTFYSSTIKDLQFFNIYLPFVENKREIEIIDNSICALVPIYGIQGDRTVLRGDYRSYIAIAKPHIYHENHKSTTITKWVRDRITLLAETSDYVIFSTGNYKMDDHIKQLKSLFKKNNAEAVQLVDIRIQQSEDIYKLLNEHLKSPKLIPYDMEDKKKFARTVSLELQKHIVEKRGIDL